MSPFMYNYEQYIIVQVLCIQYVILKYLIWTYLLDEHLLYCFALHALYPLTLLVVLRIGDDNYLLFVCFLTNCTF